MVVVGIAWPKWRYGLENRRRMLDQRNFAIIRLADGVGTSWDKNGNAWVEFYPEGRATPLEHPLDAS